VLQSWQLEAELMRAEVLAEVFGSGLHAGDQLTCQFSAEQ